MADWGTVLGPGTTESAGGRSEPDAAGRSGSIVIKRVVPNGPAAFRIVLDAAPGFAPTGAKIKALEVEGFQQPHCQERKVCAQFKAINDPGMLKPEPGGQRVFGPSANDAGVLSGLLARCSCTTKGVESYRVYVTVDVAPPPNPPRDMRFSICYECGVEG